MSIDEKALYAAADVYNHYAAISGYPGKSSEAVREIIKTYEAAKVKDQPVMGENTVMEGIGFDSRHAGMEKGSTPSMAAPSAKDQPDESPPDELEKNIQGILRTTLVAGYDQDGKAAIMHSTLLHAAYLIRHNLLKWEVVDLATCAKAAYEADAHQSPENISEDCAENIAKAVLTAAGVQRMAGMMKLLWACLFALFLTVLSMAAVPAPASNAWLFPLYCYGFWAMLFTKLK